MKKISAVFLLLLLFVITGCSQNAENTDGKTQPVSADNKEASTDYPTKPIEFIIPFAAGGITDSFARIVAEGAQKYLPNGQTIVPVNTPGAAGSIGMTELLNTEPDGYTIAFTNSDAISVAPALGQATYSPDSFQPILQVGAAPWVLSILPDSQWKTFGDLVKYIEENPGEFIYGSPSVGSPAHIVMEYLRIHKGLETKHVPYDGGALISALLGGDIDAYGGTATNYAAGTTELIVNFGDTKVDALAQVPTLKEEGYDIAMNLIFGIAAPKGIDPGVQQILHDAFKKAIEDPEVIAKIEKLNIAPIYNDAQQIQNEFNNISEMYTSVAQEIGLIE